MLLLLHTIATDIKENIITKLRKLYSLPRNPRAGNKSPVLFVKNLFARAIYCPLSKYSLKGLYIYYSTFDFISMFSKCRLWKIMHCLLNVKFRRCIYLLWRIYFIYDFGHFVTFFDLDCSFFELHLAVCKYSIDKVGLYNF